MTGPQNVHTLLWAAIKASPPPEPSLPDPVLHQLWRLTTVPSHSHMTAAEQQSLMPSSPPEREGSHGLLSLGAYLTSAKILGPQILLGSPGALWCSV